MTFTRRARKGASPAGSLSCVGAVFLIQTMLATLAEGDSVVRHAGRLQWVSPSDMVLVLEEAGPNGRGALLEVGFRNASIVHVSRDPADPWRWRDRPTSIFRWPIGTFLVVIGRAAASGTIDATRVEIPEIASGHQKRQ